MNSRLSIITVCKNASLQIEKTLHSVCQQNWKNFEHLIIDGISQDSSLEILKKNPYPQLKVFSEADKGIYDAMNKGAKRANGEYLLFLNAGDHLCDTNVLSNISKYLKNYDLIVGNIQTINKDQIKSLWQPLQLIRHPHAFQILPHCGVFIKRKLFMKSDGYDTSYRVAADTEFFNRALQHYKASYEYVDLAISTFYHDGISSTKRGRRIAKKEELRIHWQYYGFFPTLRRVIPLPYMGIVTKIKNRCLSF